MMKDSIPVQFHLKIRKDGEFLIASSKSYDIYFLNDVAKEFYLRIDGKTTIGGIVEKLLNIYEVEENVLIDDIVSLVRDLQWKNIVRLK
ncbi:PqqD family protein [Natroniella acetigena]|uniref:PqqD family protein n=1 Tax=Natroniella acetigena TaxID=52004 RepID=UPI00200B32C1|nr:PqqD family protein [Natroniella acetigena]MCK8828084.1 PqqD family protein [Natroniella acetigena]